MVFCSTWSWSSSAPPLFREGPLEEDWLGCFCHIPAATRLRCFLKHSCHWATESKWTDVWAERKRFWWLVRVKVEAEWTEQSGSLSAAVLISITHLAASLPLQSSTSIYYHLPVTSCRSLWLWPISWAEAPESSLSVKAAWAAQEKKLFVPSHLSTFFSLSLLSVFASSLLPLFYFSSVQRGSCFKRQRQQIIPGIVFTLSPCFWGFGDERIMVDSWAVLPE